MLVVYEYVHMQIKAGPVVIYPNSHAFLCRCFDNTVLLKQSAYRNRGLFLGRYCDVLSYK